jgi:ribosomal-protein-alanine N-acetyltransferase
VERRATTARTPPDKPVALPSLGRRARVRWTSYEPGIAQLVVVDQSVVPGADEIARWVDSIARTRGAPDVIRTGALFPAAADRFAAVGFRPADVLALLELDLTSIDRGDLTGAPWLRTYASRPHYRIRSLRARDHAAASLVDRRAFGDPWGYSADDLADVRRATPRHRASAVRSRGPITAFAITGSAAGNGYLQRLAVDPLSQRRGQGTALVADALTWMVRRRLRRATVNTGVDNRAALALYAATGFHPLADQLQVMQLDLVPAGGVR